MNLNKTLFRLKMGMLPRIEDLVGDKRDEVLAVSTIALYLAIVAIFFKIGGFMAELSSKELPLASIDGVIKLGAIAIMVALVGLVFIVGPIMIFASTSKWTVSG